MVHWAKHASNCSGVRIAMTLGCNVSVAPSKVSSEDRGLTTSLSVQSKMPPNVDMLLSSSSVGSIVP